MTQSRAGATSDRAAGQIDALNRPVSAGGPIRYLAAADMPVADSADTLLVGRSMV